ncbi:MAG: 2-aminoethylphosphonate--pyruvate transaminase [Chloroflexota bacterium]
MASKIPTAKDKTLFTPGPLTTSLAVKQAMLHDFGSRDFAFINTVKEIRQKLLAVGHVANMGYEAILLQGAGTYALEAVISSVTPPTGHWLIIINGAYGRRIADVCDRYSISNSRLNVPENRKPSIEEVDAALTGYPETTHVCLTHLETTTGILNDVHSISKIVKKHGCLFFVDGMSSFGAIDIDLAAAQIDYFVSSANKCIEGVPGFSYVIAEREALLATEGFARTVSLDLLAQWRGFEKNGQFRFTPPTHTLLAFNQALDELEAEGGVSGRAKRYQINYKTLVNGMRALGFREYLLEEDQGYIITSFHYPDHANFDFEAFYKKINAHGLIIYPGKVSDANCFRIGNIGRIYRSDVRQLLHIIEDVLTDMDINLDSH